MNLPYAAKPEKPLHLRLQLMLAVVTLIFSGLSLRLCQLQLLDGDHYTRKAERNFVDTVDVEAPRGRIFDRSGEPLAVNRPTHNLVFTAQAKLAPEAGSEKGPQRVPISEERLHLLMELLEFVDEHDREEFRTALYALRSDEQAGRYPAIVRSNLSWNEFARIAARLDELRPWFDIRETTHRDYLRGELAAFVTGHMGKISPQVIQRSLHLNYRPGDRVGQTGIERQWENYLRGRLGARTRVVDSRGREVPGPPEHAKNILPENQPAIPGQDIYLTIDLELQRVAYQAFRGKHAGALVALDPHTGAILAMVSMPGVDPNRYEQAIPQGEWSAWSASPLKPFIDKTVQEHFFPGSTYKVVSALAALEDPQFDPQKSVRCEGFVTYGGRKFRDTHEHGLVNFEQALVRSCNVYFFHLAMEKGLTLEKMERVARRLGLGERTGLGLNNEVKGRIPTEASEALEGTYQEGVRLNSAIGQGNVKVTVLQMAVVYAALANGGHVLTPYLIDRIMTYDNQLVLAGETQVRDPDPAIMPSAREQIHRGLLGVVNNPAGTAYSERLSGIVVAGKTGTAQVGREPGQVPTSPIQGWDTTQDHAWFAAYAPAEAPKIVVVALVEHGGIGADAAAPIVMEVIAHYVGQQNTQSTSKPRGHGIAPALPGRPDPAESPLEPPS